MTQCTHNCNQGRNCTCTDAPKKPSELNYNSDTFALDEWQHKTEWVQLTATANELGKHRADILRERIESMKKENEQLRKRITALENACAFQSVELNAIQLREARDFVFVDDGSQDEEECVARIAQLSYDRAPIGDNDVRIKPGLYVCDAEYPEEGWMPLFDDADNDADAEQKGGAA